MVKYQKYLHIAKFVTISSPTKKFVLSTVYRFFTLSNYPITYTPMKCKHTYVMIQHVVRAHILSRKANLVSLCKWEHLVWEWYLRSGGRIYNHGLIYRLTCVCMHSTGYSMHWSMYCIQWGFVWATLSRKRTAKYIWPCLVYYFTHLFLKLVIYGCKMA